ncbi:unnamed protein product [Orchesella dallaii]|uniref:Down syndrome cell adhesion molecule-like protein Dscam2 n=1 Tax=Orchesella dallaii TaxID=48710 RepID=A0ABP1RJA3_9HEXA
MDALHFFLSLILCMSFGGTSHVELNGPELELMPASLTHFSNSVGLTLTCLGRGLPPLSIKWLNGAGEEVVEIPGIREHLENSSLHFKPFKKEDYIPTVHNMQYRCSVSNPVGTFLSPTFTVRAIIDHPFEVLISTSSGGSITSASSGMSESIIEGSPALLFCDVRPTFYAQFVKVIAWKSIDPFGHETEITQDDIGYKLSTNGSLLLFNAKDRQLFVCIGENSLNQQIRASSPHFLLNSQGAGESGIAPNPKLVFPTNPLLVKQVENVVRGEIGESMDLICLAIGNPSPTFRWEKYIKGKYVPVSTVLDSLAIIQGPLLRFTHINPLLHNGTYRCQVNNTFGSVTSIYHFLVESNPVLVIEPKRKVARNGESIELTCNFRMGLENSRKNSLGSNVGFIWFKNGKELQPNARLKLIPLPYQKVLIFNARLEDQGVYQCFAQVKVSSESWNSYVASSSIVFKASAPEMVQTFISQTLQPDPFITLKCSAIGNPIPKISWFIDDATVLSETKDYNQFWPSYQKISVSSYTLHNSEIVSHLNISQLQTENSGVYRCDASNLIGNTFHASRLNVFGPIFVKEMKPLTIAAGKKALIPCPYGGYPVDQIIWQKDSQNVDQNRMKVFVNGTLQIMRTSKDTDIGRYTCVISNRKGEVASGSVEVNVMRPPVISSFKFDDNLREGQRTSISCNVISGDLPIDVVWTKDSKSIPKRLNLIENRVMDFLSVLAFENLNNEHSGEYSCTATNAAQAVVQAANLKVKVPPKWEREPENAQVILNSDHLLPCSANGIPQPTTSWYRESSVAVGLRSELKGDHKYLLMGDGSLKILQVEETDGGNYVCEAINGVGNGISKSIRLDVMVPASVSATMTSLTVAEGGVALLKCEIRGDPPIQVSWKKDSILIESAKSPSGSSTSAASSSRLIILSQKIVRLNSTVVSAELRIDSSSLKDSGVYLCLASNQYGRDEARINLEVKARPQPPQNFMVEEIGSRFIRLRWSPSNSPLFAPVPVTYYFIQWKKSSLSSSQISTWENTQLFNKTVKSSSTHYAEIDSLKPVTNYDVRLFAGNDIGHSFPTDSLSFLTLAEAPSGPPKNISAFPSSPKTAVIKWDPPEQNQQHGEILGYQVIATLQPNLVLAPMRNPNGMIIGHPQRKNDTIVKDVQWELQTELKNLKPNSQYKISVRAYNSAGIGPVSPIIFIQTPEGAPDSPPLHLSCEALSPKSLQVQWDPPPFHLSNGQILGYKVVYLPLEAEKIGEKGEVKKTNNRETTLHGLRSFTNYSVRTLAYTLGGESNLSEPVICTTEEDVPDEPADIKVVPLSGTSVLLSWLPPSFPNGIITKYFLFWKLEDGDQIKEKVFIPPSSSSSFQLEEDQFFQEIRRLQAFKQYSFWVKASTNAGIGNASRLEKILLSSNVGARISSFPIVRNMRLDQPTWLACKPTGFPNPSVSWLKNGLSLPSHISVRNGSIFISRVKDQDEGVYKCRAENEHGFDEIEHRVIIKRAPSSIPLFIGYITDSSIQIHWDPPEKVEPPLSSYILQHKQKLHSSPSSSSFQEWKSLQISPRLSSYSLENLLCGTQYSLRIFGENSVGKGEPSQELIARTNGNLPEMAKLTQVLDGNGTMIRIDLTRWSDGGCPITSFNIEYKKVSSEGGIWMRVFRRENSTKVFVIQTEERAKYDIKIRVENDAGSVNKLFRVDSSPDFFTNYAKMSERVEQNEEMNGRYEPFYTDPHVVVPIVSGVICTFAVAICVLMLVKRRNQAKPEWRFKPSTSQQTWLSSSDGNKCGPGRISEDHDAISDCPDSMSIYATVNSTKAIPMTIRNSTMRLQTYGQQDNYEAPTVVLRSNSSRSRRKSRTSASLEEMRMQQVPCHIEFPKEIEPPNQFRSSSIPNQEQKQLRLHHHLHQPHHISLDGGADDEDDDYAPGCDVGEALYHDYCSPYQYTNNVPSVGEASSRC